jgi:hypothetical protein
MALFRHFTFLTLKTGPDVKLGSVCGLNEHGFVPVFSIVHERGRSGGFVPVGPHLQNTTGAPEGSGQQSAGGGYMTSGMHPSLGMRGSFLCRPAAA